jgi:hypothetical protein
MEKVSETELLEAGRAGRVLDCSDEAARRPVDAGVLRRCCLELAGQIDPRGIRLENAQVVGQLDLAGVEVPFPLRFENCEFDSPLAADGARLHELALTGCVPLPGLLGNGLRVRRDLDLSRSTVSGALRTSASATRRSAIWLCESDIGGRLLCRDTVIRADGERAIQADRMHVGATIGLLHHFTAFGEVRLLGVRIDGSLDMTGGRIEHAAGPALDLGDAVIGGNVFIIDDPAGGRPVIRGRIDMGSTRISGQFILRNATLEEARTVPAERGYARSRVAGTALCATRLSVGAEMALEGECQVTGGLELSMSDLTSLSIGSACSLRAAGRTALDLTHAELRSSLVLHKGITVQGAVRVTGARIHGNLTLQAARLSAPERRSLVAARGVTVDGDVELQNLQATGGRLRFSYATLGSVIAAGAQLDNPGGFALTLHQATVKGSVILAGNFRSVGLVSLTRAAIEGRLECTGSSFTCPGPFERNEQGHAIEAISASIRGGMDLAWVSVTPSVDFTDASTTFLADDPLTWPPQFTITGFSYDRFEQPRGVGPGRAWDHVARSAWLARQAVHDAGPYEQAARVFRQHGYTSEAETILVARRTQARHLISGRGSALRRGLDAVFGASVAYGYRPGRVLWLLAVLLVLVTFSLEVPASRATLRATNGAGDVYTTQGRLQAESAAAVQDPRAGRAHLADACGDGQVRCFSPVLYAIDTVIPLVSLDQRATWYPDPNAQDGAFMQWWLNAATLLGWLLSSIFVLSLTRLSRSA